MTKKKPKKELIEYAAVPVPIIPLEKEFAVSPDDVPFICEQVCGHRMTSRQHEAFVTFLEVESLSETARATGFPLSSIQKWAASDWWDAMFKMVVSTHRQRISLRLMKLGDLAVQTMEDVMAGRGDPRILQSRFKGLELYLRVGHHKDIEPHYTSRGKQPEININTDNRSITLTTDKKIYKDLSPEEISSYILYNKVPEKLIADENTNLSEGKKRQKDDNPFIEGSN